MPRADEVRIEYVLTDDLDPAAVSSAAGILSDAERARAASFQRPRHRREYIAAHALLRQALSRRYPRHAREWAFEAGPAGKPTLARPLPAARLSFNLAHTDGLVACVITEGGDAGIDVECVNRVTDRLAIARRYFAPAEYERLERCAPEIRPRRFVELWTLKEASLKATGAGITGPLNTFAFETDDALAIRVEGPPDHRAADWQFALFAPSPRYRLAVAVRRFAPGDAAITAVGVSLETY